MKLGDTNSNIFNHRPVMFAQDVEVSMFFLCTYGVVRFFIVICFWLSFSAKDHQRSKSVTGETSNH